MSEDYQLGLLYLIHLLIGSDGNIDIREEEALRQVREREHIQNHCYEKFITDTRTLKERDIYHLGIKHLNNCREEERVRAFAILYRMAKADDLVHVKEVRLLLYSSRTTGVEFEDIVRAAENIPVF
jgi:uncharacterized tellurite resistance protein B-like protein